MRALSCLVTMGGGWGIGSRTYWTFTFAATANYDSFTELHCSTLPAVAWLWL
jgi:hypothetical protein